MSEENEMKLKKVTLLLEDGSTVKTWAITDDVFAIHKHVNYPFFWSITHVQTGCTFTSSTYLERDKIAEKLKYLRNLVFEGRILFFDVPLCEIINRAKEIQTAINGKELSWDEYQSQLIADFSGCSQERE